MNTTTSNEANVVVGERFGLASIDAVRGLDARVLDRGLVVTSTLRSVHAVSSVDVRFAELATEMSVATSRGRATDGYSHEQR
jgi:hypothetical protein